MKKSRKIFALSLGAMLYLSNGLFAADGFANGTGTAT